MSEGLVGLAVGIPLALSSVVVGWFLVRAMLQAADKPGMSPTVIPVVLLVGVAMLLYASNPEELAPLGDLAGVGLGGLVGLLVGRATSPVERVPLEEIMVAQNTQPIDEIDEEERMSLTDPEGVLEDDEVDGVGK